MKRLFAVLAPLILASAGLAAGVPPRMLDKANVLPLSLDDSFQFRKTIILLNDAQLQKPTVDPMIAFERQRINFGAVNSYDRKQREGHYFTFFWRANRAANLTLRLEYRQANLGAHVLAQELYYKDVKGSVRSQFKVIGDDYQTDGRVAGWRAILIENGKIVGLNQSFLWN